MQLQCHVVWRGSVARNSTGHASGGYRGRIQCSSEAGLVGAWRYCLLALVGSSIHCSGYG